MTRTMYAYVGSRTTRERNARGDGLSVYRIDPATAALTRVQVLDGLVNPSYLTLSANGRTLYTVHGDGSEVSAFRVDPDSGQLTFLNQVDTEGRNPVHLALVNGDRQLLVTNHLGATVVVLDVDSDGALCPVAQRMSFDGPIGPHRVEQKQAKPHFDAVDPSDRLVVVPDKGLDRVYSFLIDGGRLVPATPAFVQTRETAGPRNAAFHPHLPLTYVVNELDSTVTTYRMDFATGALTPLHWLTTLPATYCGNSRASSIAVDEAGRTLYASNRGDDSIAVFHLDAETGLPRWVGTTPTQGRTPRFFTLTPNGRFLFALNEDSDSIVTFAVNATDGTLNPTGAIEHCGSPVCMVFSHV